MAKIRNLFYFEQFLKKNKFNAHRFEWKPWRIDDKSHFE
jgi:hypothetical protein